MAVNQSRTGVKDPITGLNARQEAFCRFITSGYTTAQAYEAAGYDVGVNGGRTLNSRGKDELGLRPAAANLGAKLLKTPKIKKRLNELNAELQKNVEVMREAAVDRWSIDIEKTTQMLLEDRHFARTGELALRDENGNLPEGVDATPPVDWRPDARAAVQATMGVAKLHGLLVDRKEVTVIDAMQNMNNDELISFIARLQAQLGPVIDIPLDASPASDSRYSRQIASEDFDE